MSLLPQQYSLVGVRFDSQVDASIVTLPAKSNSFQMLFHFSKRPSICRLALAGAKQVCVRALPILRGIYVFNDQVYRCKNSFTSKKPHFVRAINP